MSVLQTTDWDTVTPDRGIRWGRRRVIVNLIIISRWQRDILSNRRLIGALVDQQLLIISQMCHKVSEILSLSTGKALINTDSPLDHCHRWWIWMKNRRIMPRTTCRALVALMSTPPLNNNGWHRSIITEGTGRRARSLDLQFRIGAVRTPMSSLDARLQDARSAAPARTEIPTQSARVLIRGSRWGAGVPTLRRPTSEAQAKTAKSLSKISPLGVANYIICSIRIRIWRRKFQSKAFSS